LKALSKNYQPFCPNWQELFSRGKFFSNPSVLPQKNLAFLPRKSYKESYFCWLKYSPYCIGYFRLDLFIKLLGGKNLMSAGFDACRRLHLWMLCGVFLCLLLSGAAVSANTMPEDAPILMSQPGSTKALAGRMTKRGLDTSVTVFQPGARSTITFLVTNLDLLEGEGATAFRAEFEDAMHFRHPLQIVGFEPTPDNKWVYALTVRLNDSIGDLGTVLVRITRRGMSSNRTQVSIGHESKIMDDEGAEPTPNPIEPVRSENRVGLPWTGDRVRFMQQAGFGVNPALELRLRRIGYSTWLEEQMDPQRYDIYANTPNKYPDLKLQPTLPVPTCDGNNTPPNPTDVPITCNRDNYTMYKLQNWFFKEALYNEDLQLRRRVSWALGQIFVVGGRETVQSSRMLAYIKMLDEHAFANYRVLLERVTLHPVMGNYLDMAISTRQQPNENYAREILQLFSIGTDMLNQDGTPMLDGQGNRIPSYNQETINNFTKIFTGWALCNNTCGNSQPGIPNFIDSMIVNPANHDTTQKNLLNYPGATPLIPAGQTPDQDLQAALNNVFYHPNTAPFISKLLIQQLVTSNPTPAYVKRIADIFDDNGRGTRGDLKSVVRAILLDPEARGNVKTDPDYGKLREPVLFITSFLRPFSPVAANNLTPFTGCAGQSDGVINGVTLTLDQDVFNPPTVFNYYPMDYTIPNTPLAGPEFGIFSTGTALKRPNFINQMAPPNSTSTTQTGILISANNNEFTNIPCGTRIDISRMQTLAGADTTGQTLVDTLNREIMNGSMSAQMRQQILTAVQAAGTADTLRRARTAIYLVATSSQFQVQR
jgi:uncharacterized protein (DUF1800 family)